MLVAHDTLVHALVVGLGLANAERDSVGLTVRVDLVPTALHNLHHALEEPHFRDGVTFDHKVDVAVLVWKIGIVFYKELATELF